MTVTQATKAKPIEGPSAWIGDDMAADQRWTFPLAADELAEIDAALARVREKSIHWEALVRADFPLPRLQPKLDALAGELESGRGIARLTGLPVARYSEDDLRLIWMGIGCALGQPLHQDFRGQLMRDIRDTGRDVDAEYGHQMRDKSGQAFVSSKARTLSNGPLRFHNDRCDVVALFCIRAARKGGANRIASTAGVHNVILHRRPDLLVILYAPLVRSRLGEEQGGEAMTYALPVFGMEDGKLTSHYSRTYIEAAQEMPEVPPLSAETWAAIDMLQSVSDEISYEFTQAPGDMTFFNNHAVYHARAAFEDAPGTSSERLLMRLWLSMPNSRALPADHAVLWGNVAAGARRGGIGLAADAQP